MKKTFGQTRLFLFFCLAISALLISPALAQVNGPGLSPSNQFDTVINLPGDEHIIAGTGPLFPPESIGGVPGETTQLNVSTDGVVGVSFEARFGSEVNIGGGTVGRLFAAQSNSEVNISGGTIGALVRAVSGGVVKH